MSRPGDTIGVRPTGVAGDDAAQPATELDAPPSSDRLVRLILAGLAAVLGAGQLAYVVVYGRNLFYWDDFELVFGLTGQQPVDLAWFFTWQNEHLVAMVRTVFYVVWHTTGDTRVMMVLISLGLLVATVLLLDTARLVRGRAAWTDAAIPLLLLNWGHYQSLLFPLQFFFAWSVALACACLWAFVRARVSWNRLELAVLLVAMPLLPLNGIFGALFAAPFALLAVRAAFERGFSRDLQSRRDAAFLGIAAAATFGTLILNFAGYRPVAHHPSPDGLVNVIYGISEVVAVGIGPAGIPTWPASGIVLGLVAAGALAALVFRKRESSASRRAIEALGASLLGFGALVAAIGYGRSGFGASAGFASRYSLFSAVLTCVALIVFSSMVQRRSGQVIATAVLVIVVAAQPLAFMVGRDYGRDMARVSDKILRDLASGVPIEVVAHTHGTAIYPSGDALTAFLQALSKSGEGAIGRRTLGQPPCAKELALSPRIEFTNTMTWNGKVAECAGEDPFTVFAFNAPVRVCAIRIRYRLTEVDSTDKPAYMQAFWAESSRNVFDPGVRNQTLAVEADGSTLLTATFWIGDSIDRFRIDPNIRPSRFELVDFVLITQ